MTIGTTGAPRSPGKSQAQRALSGLAPLSLPLLMSPSMQNSWGTHAPSPTVVTKIKWDLSLGGSHLGYGSQRHKGSVLDKGGLHRQRGTPKQEP